MATFADAEKLVDYLDDLGVTHLYLSPILTATPGSEHGYDVADPRDVDPLFGGLEALDRLITAAHARGIKVTMDLVPNHTSSQHPWFEAAAVIAGVGAGNAGGIAAALQQGDLEILASPALEGDGGSVTLPPRASAVWRLE